MEHSHEFDLRTDCCVHCHMPRYGMVEFPQLAVCPKKPHPEYTTQAAESPDSASEESK